MVNHEAIESFDEVSKKMKLENGVLTPAMFQRLYDLEGGRLGGEKLRTYLLALGLAVEMKNDALFIPCMVSDLNEVYR